MDKQFVIEDNFFNNPDIVRWKGLCKKYYTKFSHPDKTAINDFPGIRSLDIYLIDRKLYNYCFNKLTKIITEKNIGKLNPSHHKTRFHYSLTFNNTPYSWHYDVDPEDPQAKNLEYAGIIYLNKTKKYSEYGTKVLWEDKIIEVPNTYNRMVVYPTTTYHTLNGTFGTNKLNARMVITTFFNIIK